MTDEPAKPNPFSNVYHLTCHCQAHVLRVTLPEGTIFDDCGVCDCSHCLKRRIVWFVAPEGTVQVVRGVVGEGPEGQLSGYDFVGGQKTPTAGHQFCAVCGTHMLGGKYKEKGDNYLNLRAIRDKHFDLWDYPMILYSGLERKPDYTFPSLADLPGAQEYLDTRAKDYEYETRTYVGSCHCKAVKFAVRCKPMEEVHLCDCGCSICRGNGAVWVYPGRRNVFFEPHVPDQPYTPPAELLIAYRFGERRNGHYSCKTCGVHLFEYGERPEKDPRPTEGVPAEALAKRPPWEPENGWNGSFGLNVACLNEAGEYLVDLHGLKGKKHDDKIGRMKGLEREADPNTDEYAYKLRL